MGIAGHDDNPYPRFSAFFDCKWHFGADGVGNANDAQEMPRSSVDRTGKSQSAHGLTLIIEQFRLNILGRSISFPTHGNHHFRCPFHILYVLSGQYMRAYRGVHVLPFGGERSLFEHFGLGA